VPALRYLLDTNICIFIIKNRPEQVNTRFRGLRPGEVAISAVTEAELRFGAEKSEPREHNLNAILDFASQMEVLPFGTSVTPVYAAIRATLTRAGTPIGPLDFQIAATALTHNLILVTNNVGEFDRVPGLTVEDWTKPDH
jgi:tRNA(fMet)-specific endonuclease VapC